MKGPHTARIGVVLVLAVLAWWLPDLRRSLIFDVMWWDAPRGEAPALPDATGAGLARTSHTRVVLIDGLSADVARSLSSWSSVCERGVTLRVDVGFPSVSLPVEVALWTGLTQQQTGVVHRGGIKDGRFGRPLDPPLDRTGIPAQVADSIAVAEDHGWIARSLGFSKAFPVAGAHPVDDASPGEWERVWQSEARTFVASDASLVFVHVLRVDTAGHSFGIGPHYGRVAVEADEILAGVLAAKPAARWFLLSDHGHLGGHGGEEREVRQVEACAAGPGIHRRPETRSTPPLLHLVDVSRAIADSTGATLAPEARGRPWEGAMASPLDVNDAIPALPLPRGVIGILCLVCGIAATVWGARHRWWLAAWWFAIACVSLVVVRGEPTLSKGFIYGPTGRLMFVCWIPAIAMAVLTTWVGLGKTTIWRILAAQLAFPIAVLVAVVTATGAWPAMFGSETAPLVPHYTAYLFVVPLIVAHGAAGVALAVVVRIVGSLIPRRKATA